MKEQINDNGRDPNNRRIIIAASVLAVLISISILYFYPKKNVTTFSPPPTPTPSPSAVPDSTKISFQLMKDTALLKKIILDSLSNLYALQTNLNAIGVSDEYVKLKVTSFRNKGFADFQMQEQKNTNEKFTYKVGLTSKSFYPLKLLTGERDLNQTEASALQKSLALKPMDQSLFLTFNGSIANPSSPTFDIRKLGISLNVVDQGANGTCWAFAVAGAYEINYQLKYHKIIKASEQQIIDCSGVNTQDGGIAYKVFEWMVKDPSQNMDNARSYPYTGMQNVCKNQHPNTDFYAQNWDLVNRNPFAIASVQEIKNCICKYGSVVSSVYITDEWKNFDESNGENTYSDLTKYRNANNTYKTNHSVLIIGWDEGRKAWLVKNSWGDGWGTTCGTGTVKGYMWLDYNSCNIGLRAAWVLAK